ncbi:hypothetical protein BH09PAT1_BH09PAT1_8060 [soil metagenome]
MVMGAEETKKFLEKKYKKQLTDAEVLGYKDKLVQFFSLLIEIDRKQFTQKGGEEKQ